MSDDAKACPVPDGPQPPTISPEEMAKMKRVSGNAHRRYIAKLRKSAASMPKFGSEAFAAVTIHGDSNGNPNCSAGCDWHAMVFIIAGLISAVKPTVHLYRYARTRVSQYGEKFRIPKVELYRNHKGNLADVMIISGLPWLTKKQVWSVSVPLYLEEMFTSIKGVKLHDSVRDPFDVDNAKKKYELVCSHESIAKSIADYIFKMKGKSND